VLTSTLLSAGLILAGLICAGPASAIDKHPAPSFKPAAPAGGGAHLPGGMGGGAHMPGGMAGGGAHIPGGMGGGAHLPSGMAGGPHIPGGMAGGAHVPSSAAHLPEHASAGGAEHSLHTQHAGYHTPASGAHREGATENRAREPGKEASAREPGREANARDAASREALGRAGARGDPRIGGAAASHTRGLVAGAAVGVGAGLAAHHMAAHFMEHPQARDIGHDRAFVSEHAADFHERYVHDFSPVEFARWQGGAWSVGWHFGRLGWWWDVGGVWYPYAEPIYPYPLEVAALTVYGTDTVDLGYPVADTPAIPPLPAGPVGVYSCADPPGYFPTVQSCAQPWQFAESAPDR